MTSGISFGPGQIWLVSRNLSDPIMGRVVERLAESDPALAERVQMGIYALITSTQKWIHPGEVIDFLEEHADVMRREAFR